MAQHAVECLRGCHRVLHLTAIAQLVVAARVAGRPDGLQRVKEGVGGGRGVLQLGRQLRGDGGPAALATSAAAAPAAAVTAAQADRPATQLRIQVLRGLCRLVQLPRQLAPRGGAQADVAADLGRWLPACGGRSGGKWGCSGGQSGRTATAAATASSDAAGTHGAASPWWLPPGLGRPHRHHVVDVLRRKILVILLRELDGRGERLGRCSSRGGPAGALAARCRFGGHRHIVGA
mmetsp:Transcript_30842/g.79219  ORF Transcript_30842/g.79219 Transcript_30842/m.79219 type:complete len:234 (+) Transcript_30842:2165-2866(+)